MADVLLVSMPFGPLLWPSLGLSLLKPSLESLGVSVRIRYFTLTFAQRTGEAFYSDVAAEGRTSIRDLAGEWLFSRSLFGRQHDDVTAYLDECLRKKGAPPSARASRPVPESLVQRILRVREWTEGFMEDCLQEVLRERPRIVGFTSVFQQHVASLALAKRIKEASPGTFVVMGGANCEDVMGAETVRQFPFVDAVVSGEADLVFSELARRVLAGSDVRGLPGVRTLETVEAEFRTSSFPAPPVVRDLDALPYPDYSDYFEQFAGTRFAGEWQPSVLFETSRGCWWGERSHCTFCGLNGATMSYRSKSSKRALDELLHLTARHPGCDVQVVDNILEMGYFKDFVPALAQRRLGLSLFYETKANLRKEQVRMLREAGIRDIQPGIESFSDAVLRLMRKGVSALQNVQLLKWCKELGVRPHWNFLWGFPDEPADEYDRMARLAPLLTHLPAPVGLADVRLDRFSPNFFDAERLGFADVRPLPAYRHVYPLSEDSVANLACYFSFRYRQPRDVEAYAQPVLARLRSWQRSAGRSDLFSVDVDGRLLLWDLRPGQRDRLAVLEGLDRVLYIACDTASDVPRLTEAVARMGFTPVPDPSEVAARMAALAERGLAVHDGPRYLALAVPLGEYTPPAGVVQRFYQTLRGLGRRNGKGWIVPVNGDRPRRSSGKRSRRAARSPKRPRPRSLTPAHFSWNARGELVVR
ncbi:MAG: RiPP maturation radical SAM protein 1 [Acidobacteria bacterium]|nr:RiPP maturation radical SAM protein 1 [Acidobacteriota bacterium]